MPSMNCNFLSYTLRRAVDINIIVPGITSSDCDKSDVTHEVKYKYPVLYLLHGYCNDYSTWGRYTALERYAEERRIAVVTFSAENNFYSRTADYRQESNIELMFNPNYEEFLHKELPEFVRTMFPISEKKSDTYIAGLSMGGYGALFHAFKYPNQYAAIGAFSPLTTLNEKPYEDEKILSNSLKENDPLILIRKNNKENIEMPSLYYTYGTDDFLIEFQEWFLEKIENENLIFHSEILEGYGHEWEFWDIQLRKFLNWLPRTDWYYKNQKVRQI